LNEKGSTEWDKFVKIEEKAVMDEEDVGMYILIRFATVSPTQF
jgi:hypothetical protein